MTEPTARPLALVTGASSGIGLELARQFAQRGFDLVVTAEDDALDAAAVELRGHGVAVVPVRADLREYDGVELLWQAITGSGRPLDAAALNAGVGVGRAFVDNDLRAELDLIRLNCTSTVHLAKRVAQHMAARGQGRILVTASIAALAPAPYEAAYGASKAFVHSFALALREELADSGVSVTSVLPGPTETEFFDRAGLTDTKLGASDSKDDPAHVARQAIEGMLSGAAQVRAGSLSSRAMGALSQLVPDRLAATQHAAMSAPGSAST